MQKAADEHLSLTPSKVDLPQPVVPTPVTPSAAAQPPNAFNYPPTVPIASHSNPNTPVNQRNQRHANQPKFSTPQPGRHQNQGWNPPHNVRIFVIFNSFKRFYVLTPFFNLLLYIFVHNHEAHEFI